MIFKLFEGEGTFDDNDDCDEGPGAVPSLHVRSDDPVAQMRALRMQVGGIRLASKFMTPELQEDFLVTYHCTNSSWDWYIFMGFVSITLVGFLPHLHFVFLTGCVCETQTWIHEH